MYTETSNLMSVLPFALITNLELNELCKSQVIPPNLDNHMYTLIEDLPSKLNVNIRKCNNLLTLLRINIRSLTKNIDKLHQFISTLPIQPEIIAITETKLNKLSNLNLVKLNNYNFIYKNSLSCAGGVGMYIKEGVDFVERKEINFFNETVESIWANIVVNKKHKITIGVIYRHPNNNINIFTDQFNEFLQLLANEQQSLYVTGDFNINILTKSNKNISNYLSMTKSFNLHNIIKQPTRVCKTTSTCIDHIYTNNKNSIHKKFILIDAISDHFPLFCTIKIKYTVKKY